MPIIVVKGGQEAEVLHDVDLKDWLDAGWTIKGDESEKKTRKPRESKTEDGE